MQSRDGKSCVEISQLRCCDAFFLFSWFVSFLSSYSGIQLLHSLEQVFVGTAVVGAAVLHTHMCSPPHTGVPSSTQPCRPPPLALLSSVAQVCSPPRTEDGSPPASAQLVGRCPLLVQVSVLWKALGHPGCAFSFQMVTAFFLSSDCSVLSSSVEV